MGSLPLTDFPLLPQPPPACPGSEASASVHDKCVRAAAEVHTRVHPPTQTRPGITPSEATSSQRPLIQHATLAGAKALRSFTNATCTSACTPVRPH